MAYDVFISYSNKDKLTSDAACAYLEANGIRCWIAPRDIVPGTDWGESIIDAINNARIMLLIFSSNSNASTQIKREIERAVNKGIPVIPFRIEDVLPSKTLEYFISTQHWLDALTPPLEQHLQYLVSTIRAMLANEVDGSEKEAKEPPFKRNPAVSAAMPPPLATSAPAVPPEPTPVDSGRKFSSPLVIGILVLALAVIILAAVLWKQGVVPTPNPVAVKEPENTFIAPKVQSQTEREDNAKVAIKPQTIPSQKPAILPPVSPQDQKEIQGDKDERVPAQPSRSNPNPLRRFQVGREWRFDWQSQFRYRGALQIRQQLGTDQYLTRITVSFFSKNNKETIVTMDGLLTIRGKDVVINCSNASESWWNPDDFYLEWNNDIMTGYNIDKKGRRGFAIFRFIDDSSPSP